jgi:hypothetical protein
LGFVVAPLPVVAPLTLIGVGNVGELLEILLVSYAVTLSIGIPVHFALGRLGFPSLRAYFCATTFCVAAIVGAFALLLMLLPPPLVDNPHSIRHAGAGGWIALTLVFEGFALLGTWIFWGLSVRMRKKMSAVVHSTSASERP